MATLSPTLTLASTDVFASQELSLSVSDSLTVTAPVADVSRMATNDNIGNGVGVILPESTDQYYVYVKHLGILASDFSTASHASNDFVTLGDVDSTAGLTVKLQPGEFAFFAVIDAEGLKVQANTGNCILEYAYWTKG